ncbi:PREDICTED: uncharacterized protein LOC109183038 [Ipomoea nil]|uniref:uncharacterized protein LOC109183038 n=1 Tax=Ipomoea nil TaxID=35883 RepID=UPI000901A59C|nr:PREDICTED: uncharacterized protein LOC109183038 [Ipomoea nil]
MAPSRRHARTSEAATNDQLVQSLHQLTQITQTLSHTLLNNRHPPQNGNRDVVRQVSSLRPPIFAGEEDPTVLEEWIRMFDKIFQVVVCPEDRQVEPACRQDPGFSWENLEDKLRERFYPAHVKAEKYEEFLHLKQVPLSVMEYRKKFLELARFASVLVPTEESKVEKFVAGLNFEARKALTVSKPKTLNEAYLCAVDLYRVQQVQKGIQESRKRSFETTVAPVVISLSVTGAEPSRSLQRNDFKSGKTPPPIRNNKVKGKRSVCKKCGSGHPDMDCHGKLVECFACGKKGHRSFKCVPKRKTSASPKPAGSVRP